MVGIEQVVSLQIVPAVVGAMTGTILSFSVQKWNSIQETKEEREYLRRSILAELGSMESLARLEPSRFNTQLRVSLETPSIIYKANSSRLSLLSKEETEHIINFYSSSQNVNEKMDRTLDLVESSEHTSSIDFTPINNSIEELRNHWEKAVRTIISNLDEYPEEIIVDETHYSIEDLNSADLWVVINNDLSEIKEAELNDRN